MQMTTKSITNRVISYFFLFDFYHFKGQSEDNDIFAESIIYLYPPKEDIKKQKLSECGEIISSMQYLKYDLFSAIPKEFYCKRSLITTEHYGRHCAFLVLSKDRFTIEETGIHLNHILQLFHILYGTFNHVQSTYPDMNQMQSYLKQTLTPIVEHVFNENRSIRNLFSAIDYAPLKKNNQLCLLHVKHFLIHLQSTYKIQNGFFAYEKRILHSTFDAETTYYIQVILGLERILSTNETSNSSRVETKLRNGVSLVKIYIRRPPSLEPILNAVNATSDDHSNDQISTEPIRINSSKLSNIAEQPPMTSSGSGKFYPASYASNIRDEPTESSGDITDLDTDPTGDISPLSKTDETDSLASSVKNRKNDLVSSRNNTITNNSHNSKEESLTDDQKVSYRYVRSRAGTLNRGFEESTLPGQMSQGPHDSLDGVIFQPMPRDLDSDSCGEFAPEDLIILPPKDLRTTYQGPRRKTITNTSDMYDTEYKYTIDPYEGSTKWGDVPEKNDENERDEFFLYVQRNSRMIFAGIIEKRLLNEEYLQKLWCLILTGMADLDRDIQVIPIAGDTSKHNSDVKFQFNDNTHQVQYERLANINNYYNKIPSSDSACMAFSARMKMNENPERKMVGFSRGNNLISINRVLPDRVTCFCRRFQEPR